MYFDLFCNHVCSEMPQFPIFYFYGGDIIEGPHGPEYSGGAKFITNGCHHTTYEEVKLAASCVLLSKGLRVDEIHCRVEDGKDNKLHFSLISIVDERSWRRASRIGANNYGVVHLILKTSCLPVIGNDDDDFVSASTSTRTSRNHRQS